MAGRDNVLYHAAIGSGTTAGTVVPLSMLYGIENVRQGYGTPVLKNIRAVYSGCYGASVNNVSLPVEVKNSNWIDSAGLSAIRITNDIAYARDSLSFMRGRDKVLAPNTSWTVNVSIPSNTTAAGDVYVLFEIEYSAVEGRAADTLAGSPVMKTCTNASVTGSANTPVLVGTFDNLLQGISYVMSEVSSLGVTETSCNFAVIEGFSNQRGLTRIIPIRNYGIAEQLEGSVILTKQTYNISIICANALSAAPITIFLEMVASSN